MFSHILVVSTGYIMLLSICPMLKAGKLHSIASSAKYLKSYLKITLRVQKYGGVLLNRAKIPLIVLCWKSQHTIGVVSRF